VGVWIVAVAYVALQLGFSGRYGYFRDEFYYLACGEHLAWGYVDHPPMVALIAKVSRLMFGDSLLGIRALSAVAGGATIVLAGRLTTLLGGDRWAACVAALAVAIAPVFLFLFHILSMNAWDILLWTAVAAVVTRIAAGGHPALWLLVGTLVGIGVETKHSMIFLVLGLGAGVLLTPARRWLMNRFLWIGALIAAAIIAPHAWWQMTNGWPTIEFVRNATALKNAPVSPLQFVVEQVLQMHPVNFMLLLAGLGFFFRGADGRFRFFGWAYVAIFLLLIVQNSKAYYLAPIYPLMFAGGAVGLSAMTRMRAPWIRPAGVGLMVITGAALAPVTFPVLPVASYIAYAERLGITPSSGERHEIGILPQHYADMFGWDDIVRTIARVYWSLPDHEREDAAIFVSNYGEAGAVDFLGPRFGLPKKAISPHNNYFLWGPGHVSGNVLIVVGGDVKDHVKSYEDVRRVDTIECGSCMPYENHRPVYVLRRPIRSMDEIWRTSKIFI
jgi:hypothetical protein